MTVTLTIKKVPVALARELRRRAALHHRSLQGELLRMLESAAGGVPAGARDPAGVHEPAAPFTVAPRPAAGRSRPAPGATPPSPRDGRLTLEQTWARSRRIMADASVRPREGESADVVRRDRDAREARGR